MSNIRATCEVLSQNEIVKRMQKGAIRDISVAFAARNPEMVVHLAGEYDEAASVLVKTGVLTVDQASQVAETVRELLSVDHSPRATATVSRR